MDQVESSHTAITNILIRANRRSGPFCVSAAAVTFTRRRMGNKNTPDVRQAADWLTGGGEMGERTRAFDWSQTPVGPVEDWPQSLKTAVFDSARQDSPARRPHRRTRSLRQAYARRLMLKKSCAGCRNRERTSFSLSSTRRRARHGNNDNLRLAPHGSAFYWWMTTRTCAIMCGVCSTEIMKSWPSPTAKPRSRPCPSKHSISCWPT